MKDLVSPCKNPATNRPLKEAVRCSSNRVRSTPLQFSLQPVSQPKAVQKINSDLCDCAECKIDGERVPKPAFHDCEYCRRRNRLIPQAERIANERVVVRQASEDNGESAQRWTRVFATAMDALAQPLLNGASGKLANFVTTKGK